MPSKPAYLSSAGKKPPACESPMAPVSGDLALAVMRLWPEKGAPVSTLSISVSTFSGPSASAPAGMCLRM